MSIICRILDTVYLYELVALVISVVVSNLDIYFLIEYSTTSVSLINESVIGRERE